MNKRVFRVIVPGPGAVTFEGRHDYRGFYIQHNMEPTNLGCDKARDFYTELALILDRQSHRLERWENFISQCTSSMRPEMRLMIHSNTDEVRDDLVMAFERPEYIEKTKTYLQSFEALLNEKFDKSERVKKIKRLNEYRTLLDKEEWPYLSLMMELIIAIKADNYSWAKNSLYQLLNYHPFRLIFEVDHFLFDESWTQERQTKLFLNFGLEASQFFKKSLKMEMDIFMTLMGELNRNRTFDSLSTKYNTDWSIVRLREGISTKKFSRLMPSFWYDQLSTRTNTALVGTHLQELIQALQGGELNNESLWILVENYPGQDAQRDSLFKHFSEISEKDTYLTFLRLKLLSQESFKRHASQTRPEFRRPLFQLEREYYRSLLYSGRAREFALLNLMALGDLNPDYLWLLADRAITL